MIASNVDVDQVDAHWVWDAMRENALDLSLDGAPEEVVAWARLIQGNLRDAFNVLRMRVDRVARQAQVLGSRKEQSAFVLTHHKEIADLVFRALDGRAYGHLMWRHIEPGPEEGRFVAQ